MKRESDFSNNYSKMSKTVEKRRKRHVDNMKDRLQKKCLIHSPGNSSDGCKVIGNFGLKYYKVRITKTIPRFASAVTWSRGPRPCRWFTHGPLITAKCPTRVRVRPDHKHGNGMGGKDMERGPDSV